MDSFSMEDTVPSFCVGHHETNRSLPVTAEVVRKAHESNVCLPCCNTAMLRLLV